MKFSRFLFSLLSLHFIFVLSTGPVLTSQATAYQTSNKLTEQQIETVAFQLIDAARDDKALSDFHSFFDQILNTDSIAARNIAILSTELLAKNTNSQNWQINKAKLSRILNYFATKPFVYNNLSQYIVNLGPNPPLPPPEELERNPGLKEQIKFSAYSIAFTPEALLKLSTLANDYYHKGSRTDSLKQTKFIYNSVSGPQTAVEVLNKFIFPYPMQDSNEMYFLVRASPERGGMHMSSLFVKWVNGVLHLGIVDSLGLDTSFRKRSYANDDIESILRAAEYFRTKVVINVTPMKRQNDIVSCFQFVLNDYFTFSNQGFFKYVSSVTTERPELTSMIYEYSRSPNALVQAIPEHPLMLEMAQTKSVFQVFGNGLVQRYVLNPESYVNSVKEHFWPLAYSDKTVNAKAQIHTMNLVPILLADILSH